MRIVLGIALTLTLATVVWAEEPTTVTPPSDAAASQVSDRSTSLDAQAPERAEPETPAATDPAKPASVIMPPPPTPQDVLEAKKLFKAGIKLKSAGKTETAFEKFELAARLDPRSVEYATAREFARQQLVMEALERGNKAMRTNNEVVAAAEFRQALDLRSQQ